MTFILYSREIHRPKSKSILWAYNTKWNRICSFKTEKQAENYRDRRISKYPNQPIKIEYKIEEE